MIRGVKSNYEIIPFYSYRFSGEYLFLEEYTGDSLNDGAIRAIHLADIIAPLLSMESYKLMGDSLIQFTDIHRHVHSIPLHEIKMMVEKEHIIRRRFILGTDRFGRDVLSQLMIGTRVSLSVGFISVFISVFLGISLGGIAGYFRGWIDDVIVWFINVIWSFPTLLLVIAITFALGKGFWQVFVAVGLSMWVEVARVVRGQVIGLREKEYVEAARALGFGHLRILFKHILPNVMGVVIVISAANFATAILLEAGLSFLGIGVQPPMPSWGTMINENKGYLILDQAYLAILPGICICLMVLSFMLIGNGLRDAMDVREEVR